MIEFIGEYDVPEWSICALEYGDYSGITENEHKAIDEWLSREFPKHDRLTFDYGEREPFFTKHPAFGLACECLRAKVYGYRKKQPGNNAPGHYMGPDRFTRF